MATLVTMYGIFFTVVLLLYYIIFISAKSVMVLKNYTVHNNKQVEVEVS